MTKVRDIATFLGKTEAFNSTNKRLAFDSNEVTTLTPTIATDIINQYATVIYNTVDSLPANPINGARAWVKANNRFYVADSSWHNTLLVNVPPTINIANYDSVLTDSQSLTMTIQVTDSFENLDIITFGATLSPSNITDSAVLSFSRDSSVVALAINPDSATSNARSFQITFSANDQINLATSVKSFTIDRGFVLTPLSQILSLSGGTIINADSDLAGGVFQLTSGDILSDSAASLEAIVSSATFLDNTEQNRTYAGDTVGVDAGVGKVRVATGYVDSSKIGWIWSGTSSNTTTASRFRTGNTAGGQIITHLSEQPASWIANDLGPTSMYIHGIVDGNFYRIYPGTVMTQYSLTTGGGSTRKGTFMTTSVNHPNYEDYSVYANGKDGGGNDDFTRIAADGFNNGVSGFKYNWPIPSYTANWTYNNVTWKECSGNLATGTNQQSQFTINGNVQSNFPVGGKIHIGEDATVNSPTAQEVYESKHFTILGTYVAQSNMSTSGFYIYYNHPTYGTTTGAQIWSGAGNSLYVAATGARTNDTIVLIGGGMGYTQSTVWGSSVPIGNIRSGTSFSTNIPVYVRAANLCNEVYILSEDYPRQGAAYNLENTDLRPSYSSWSSTSNASGASFGTSPYPIYRASASASTQLELSPSPAGGVDVDIGTSVVGSYIWENGTKIVVDDNTGFTAGKFIQKKT